MISFAEGIVLALSIRLSEFSFRAISKQLLTKFQGNFVKRFNTDRCAYHFHVWIRPFNLELCPLISYALCIQSKLHFLAIYYAPFKEVGGILLCKCWSVGR